MLTATSSSPFEPAPDRVVPQDEHYGYDGLYQVKSYGQGWLNESRTAIGGVPMQAENFDYDPSGNWQRHEGLQFGESPDPSVQAQERVNNRDNQIVQINGSANNLAYDKAGNMKKTPVLWYGTNAGSSGPLTLQWDAWNRQVSSGSYDGLSRRITGNSFAGGEIYYNDQWKPVEDRFLNEFDPDLIYCQYLWGARHRDDLILRRRDSNVGGDLDETIWVTHDYFSPATLLLETSTTAFNEALRMGFSPFGMMRYIGPADITSISLADALEEYDWSYGFQGQFLDLNTGLYNYGYRDYSPWLGRWLSRDPIGEEGGINLYAYAGNNALNRVDYLGLRDKSVVWVISFYSNTASFSLEGSTIPFPPSNNKVQIIQGSLTSVIKEMTEADANESCPKPHYLDDGDHINPNVVVIRSQAELAALQYIYTNVVYFTHGLPGPGMPGTGTLEDGGGNSVTTPALTSGNINANLTVVAVFQHSKPPRLG